MSRPQAVTPLLRRAGHPAILPIPRRSSGNNVPHSMTKTRRNWSPNTSKFNLPVNVLGGAAFVEPSIPAPGSSKFPRYPEFKNVKMAVKDLRTLDKNGGLEGMLLSRPSSKLTPFGRQLRNDLFAELHFIRESLRDVEAQMRDEEIERLVQEEKLSIEAPGVAAGKTTTQ